MKNEQRHDAFLDQIAPFANMYDCFVDVGCGAGELSVRLSQRFHPAMIDMVDKKRVARSDMVLQRMESPYLFHEQQFETMKLENGAMILGVHACGDLSDAILTNAVAARAPFAFMPCCYTPHVRGVPLAQPPDARKLLYRREQDYFDEFRLQFAREHDYLVKKCQIDARISPMNNVLIGIPLDSGSIIH
jgi:hypothetical protein